MAQTAPLDPSATPCLARPRVKSFDVFDTLIARRCVTPERVFALVESRAPLPGFAAARIAAEAEVSAVPYTIDTIYDALQRRLGLDAERRDALKRLEIETELENVTPIAEHLAEVRPCDILISDMYLGRETIAAMLASAGFALPVPLVVSSDGKRSGRVWGEILPVFEIEEHLGDNPLTDGLSPLRAGVRARRTEVSTPNRIEATLIEIGLPDVAALAREARLASWSVDPGLRALQLAEASYNLPILLMGSVLALRLAARLGLRRILFSSRDCVLWLPICRAVAAATGADIDLRYFFTSRLSRFRASPDYLDYARAEIDERTLVVDLCGTGWSLGHLFERIGRPSQPLAFLHRLPARADYEALAPTPGAIAPRPLLIGVEGCNNSAIEMLNYAAHGMVADVRRALGAFVPVFAADERSAATQAAIAEQHAMAARFTRSLEAAGLGPCLDAPDDRLATVAGALYRGLSGNLDVYRRYLAEHMQEDGATLRELARPA